MDSPQSARTCHLAHSTARARPRLPFASKLGFTVEDVGEYLALYDADPRQDAQTQLLLDKVLTAIEGLEGKRRDTERALAELGDIRRHCETHLAKRGR